MACSDSKCPIKKEGERQIACWLCDKLFHVKCVGLLSRTTDQLNDSSLGLRWCCPKCRVVDIEFYRFFMGTHSELKEMRNDFAALFEKFHRFEEMFTKFRHLDSVLENKGLSGPNALKDRRNVEQDKEPCDVPVVDGDIAATSGAVPISSASLSLPKSMDLIELSPNLPSMPSCPDVSVSVPTLLPVSNNSSSGVPAQTRVSRTAQRGAVVVSAPSNISAPKDLVVVKPRKVIFLSRLSCDTSVDDIVHYVKSRVNVPFQFDCYKLKPALNRSISSFKLFVPSDRFDSIVNPAFWPQGIIVREFVFRENNRNRGVALPTVSSRKN